MIEPRDVIIKYLDEARIMQVATSVNNQPWVATVYFAVDNLHNIFWVSRPDRRHSQELVANPQVAGAIALPHTPGEKVRGVQFSGVASEVTDADEIRHHFLAYSERFGQPELADAIISGQNPVRLYQIKPELFVLFDEVNYPDNPRQEWRVGS